MRAESKKQESVRYLVFMHSIFFLAEFINAFPNKIPNKYKKYGFTINSESQLELISKVLLTTAISYIQHQLWESCSMFKKSYLEIYHIDLNPTFTASPLM